MLLALRALQGFVVSSCATTSNAVLADIFAPEERGRAMGIAAIPFLVGAPHAWHRRRAAPVAANAQPGRVFRQGLAGVLRLPPRNTGMRPTKPQGGFPGWCAPTCDVF